MSIENVEDRKDIELFKKGILALGEKLHDAYTKKDQLAINLYRFGIQKGYEEKIRSLLYTVNQELDTKEALQKIKQVDKYFLQAQGFDIEGHIMFTRHGACDRWRQKKLGVKPNAAIASSAKHAMSVTNDKTQHFFCYAEQAPKVVVSPMTRAMQTAGLLLPKEMKNADITIAPALAENTNAPSGFDVRSKADLAKLREGFSFWQSFKLFFSSILFFFSKLFYGKSYFERLNEKRQEAIHQIKSHADPLNDIAPNGEVAQDLTIEEFEKLKQMQSWMEKTKDRDLWFVGHGKNFKTFFKKTFDLDVSFNYAETLCVYKMKASKLSSNKKIAWLTTPYSFTVNQKTGKIEGKFIASMPIVKAQQIKFRISNAPKHFKTLLLKHPKKMSRDNVLEDMPLLPKKNKTDDFSIEKIRINDDEVQQNYPYF